MKSVLLKSAILRRAGLVTACLALVTATQLVGAGKSPMKVLKYDPTAEKMPMFDAIEEGALKVRVVAHDARGGNMYFENLSGKPLTVELPDALATVHVLKQFGGGMMGGMGGGMGGMGGGMGGMGGGMGGGMMGGMGGGGQMGGGGMGGGMGGMGGGMGGMGGGMGGMGGGMGGMGGGGGGFFSIPPERTAEVPFKTVCLNHGKPDPAPRMTYIPVRLEVAVENKVLRETLRLYVAGNINFAVAQAATWHITDNMSWEELASKTEEGLFSSLEPSFSLEELQAAQQLLNVAARRAVERAKHEPEVKPTPVRARRAGGEVASVGESVRTKIANAKKVESKKVLPKKVPVKK